MFDLDLFFCMPAENVNCTGRGDDINHHEIVHPFPQNIVSPNPNVDINSNTVNCWGQANGLLIPNPLNCGAFFECNFNLASELHCPNGQLFEISAKRCLPQNRVNCFNRGARQAQGELVRPQVPTPLPLPNDQTVSL